MHCHCVGEVKYKPLDLSTVEKLKAEVSSRLAPRKSESRNCGLRLVYMDNGDITLLVVKKEKLVE